MAVPAPVCPACSHDRADITQRKEFDPVEVQCALCGNEGTVLSWKFITANDAEGRIVQRLGVEVTWKIPRFYLTPAQIAVMKELIDE